MTVEKSQRIANQAPYLFAEIDRVKAEVVARGVDVISLGIGDPDLPTPDFIIEALCAAARVPANHQYSSYAGMAKFREAAAKWYQQRFGVTLSPTDETLGLIGSKEAIANFPFAFIDQGDIVLYTEPGYPVYKSGTLYAGGIPYALPLLEENQFLPDLDAVPMDVRAKAKILWINYPNNPTSAPAPDSFFEKAIEFCRQHNIILAHDAAYTEVFTGAKPKSILEFDGAREVAIEFHSLSKTFNMTGWRLGIAAGNATYVKALGQIKTNVDSGQFQAVQMAGVAALERFAEVGAELNPVYAARRQLMTAALQKAGITPFHSDQTFYLWSRVPQGFDSAGFCGRLLQEQGVVVTPGNGFGPSGEGYFRISLTAPDDRLEEAARRIESLRL